VIAGQRGEELGQPQCESNLVSLRNSSLRSATPVDATRLLSVYSPVKGASVAACRSTAYSCGLSCARHSSSTDDLAACRVGHASTVRTGASGGHDDP